MSEKARVSPRFLTWTPKNVFTPLRGMRNTEGRAVVGGEGNKDDIEFKIPVKHSMEVHQKVVQTSLEVEERPGIERKMGLICRKEG